MTRTLIGAAGAPDQFPLHEALQPSATNADLVVRNVYPVLNEDGSVATRPGPLGDETEPDWPTDGPAAGEPPVHDVDSHVEATEYAFSRFEPRAAGSEPEILTYGVPAVMERRVRDGWVANWTPRKAAALFAGTFLLFNAVGNAASIIGDTTEEVNSLLHRAKTGISRLFGNEQKLVSRTPVEVRVPGEVSTVEYTYNDEVGESTPEPEDITNLTEELKAHGANGETVLGITVVGDTSDEWGPNDGSLGQEDEENTQLGIDRAADFGSALIDEAMEEGAPMPPKVKTDHQEHVLSPETIDSLSDESLKHGLSLRNAIAIYNKNPQALPESLRTMLDEHLGSARGVRVVVTYQKPGTTELHYETIEHEGQTSPEDKDHDYDLYWGIPIPFLPRYRKEPFIGTRYESWLRPGAKPDERWVELFKDAMHLDETTGEYTLGRFAAMESRKYWLLAREDRFDYTLSHNYTDSEGNPQSMHVLFVDHDPTEETVAAYKGLLNDLSQMRDGKVAEQFGLITVFPRDQAGLGQTPGRDNTDYPHHPADIGLGVDKQESKSVLGIAMPSIGLIEVHMPENPTAAELREYYGAVWVAAHEATGHGTDTTGEPTVLRPTGPAQLRHYTANNPWAAVAVDAFERFADVDTEGEREFNITRQVVTPEGEVITLHDRVTGSDPRLGETQNAELLGRKPDEYAASSPAELYAQIGAQVVSGALIPYDEAGVEVVPRHPSLGRGYGVDPQLRRLFEERTGWSRENARPLNEEEFTLMLATDDPVTGPMIEAARRKPMEDDRVTLLSRVHTLDPESEHQS